MKSNFVFGLFVLSSLISTGAYSEELKCGHVQTVSAGKGEHSGVFIRPVDETDPTMSFGGGFRHDTEARFLAIALAGLQNPKLILCINADFVSKGGITKMEIKYK